MAQKCPMDSKSVFPVPCECPDDEHRKTVAALRKQRAAPWTFRAWGTTVEIRSAGWGGIAWVNPRGDSDKGIPSREDRDTAALIVRAVNAHESLVAFIKSFASPQGPKKWRDMDHTDLFEILESLNKEARAIVAKLED